MRYKTNFVLVGLSLLVLSACGGNTGSEDDGADPGVVEVPIAYIKRPIPTDEGETVHIDLREPQLFTEGGDVYIRDNSSAVATEKNITSAITGGTGDVKGLNVSYDGKRILFSLRLVDLFPDDDTKPVPTWNIYEYDLEAETLRQVITGLAAGDGDDLSPAYLPDGRIVFSSSRQQRSAQVLSNEGRIRFSALDEDRNTIAVVLHVMNNEGGEIHQISFNQSHDLYPTVMSNKFDGQILFSRWDNAGGNSELNLYKVNPDGSELELLYGAHSHETGTDGKLIQYSLPREMPDGHIAVVRMPFTRATGTWGGGDIAIINTGSYVDNLRPVWTLEGLTDPAEVPATINDVTNNDSTSPNGRYASAYPLWDGSNRMLVSKSTCQIEVDGVTRPCIEPWFSDAEAIEVSPAYGIWIYDLDSHTEKVIVGAQPGMVMTEVVAMQARTPPGIIKDRKETGEIDTTWADEGVGVVNIRSVYDMGGGGDTLFDGCFLNVCSDSTGITSVNDLGDPAKATADQRPARFVRFVKAVAIPDDNDPFLGGDAPALANTGLGPFQNLGMREIVGYAPVEPDGSVKVKVPADVPLGVEVLDKFARRIGPRHENWFQVNPGDTLTCMGCHRHAGDVPFVHHRSDASAPSVNSGLPASLQFDNTLIPGTEDVYFGDFGATMAEVLFRRVDQMEPARAKPELSIDVRYEDIWTNPNVRAKDSAFEFVYGELSPAVYCTPWSWRCRSVINYDTIIHPIWQADRGENTCTTCHSDVDAMGAEMVPAGLLDLTDGIDPITGRNKSYEELLFRGNDAETPSPMSANGARFSYFIEKMTETELDANKNLSTQDSDLNYIDHSGFLEANELRLISEWIDLGAQFFNDPFHAEAP
ncbi:MAG: hypothetical protein GY820_26630 [Gammaproteobacteria bacterium]|nr:hypothetical protein [Gammaproteobacteria bacterium]